MSSAPKDAGRAGKVTGGERSTIETVPSEAHAQLQSQLLSSREPGVNLRNQSGR